jgi:hypothetical protein
VTAQLFPLVSIESADVDDVVNPLLDRWAHPLGACRRPFRQEGHVMYVHGEIIGATVTASTVSATCAGRSRKSVVELARIARHPDRRWVIRPLLRFWREAIAPAWPCWPVEAAVSYALPGYEGGIYRFDGWTRVGEVRPSPGGGTWSNKPKVNDIGEPGAKKTLWLYEYHAEDQS